MDRKINKKNYFYILLISFLSLISLTFISSINPIVTRGEGREALVVQAIKRQGNLILPLRNGVEIPSKPPLFHWISYSISNLTGNIDEISLRAPSVISSVVILAIFYIFLINQLSNRESGKEYSPKEFSLLSCLICLSSLEFIRYLTQARVDMVFTACLFLSLLSMYKFITNNSIISFFSSVLFLSFSALAKGPFGIIIPFLIIFSFLLLEKKKDIFYSGKLIRLSIILLLSVIIPAIWYLLAYRIGGEDFLNIQLGKENLYRVVKSDVVEVGHNKPFYFSFVYLFLAILPWTLFLPRIIQTCLNLNLINILLKKDILFKFFVSWFLIFLLAVTVSVSKRSVYFLPAVPALSYIICVILLNSKKVKINKYIIILEKIIFYLLYFILLLVFFIFSISLVLSFFGVSFHNFPLERYLVVISCLILFTAIKIFRASDTEFFSGRIELGLIKFSTSFIMLFFVAQITFGQIIFSNENSKDFSLRVNELVNQDQKIYQLGGEFYALSFNLNRDIKVLDQINELLETETSNYILVSEKNYLTELKPKFENNIQQLLISDKNLANREGKVILIKTINKKSKV